jgi:type I restriction-modification system DNA methylase subunit
VIEAIKKALWAAADKLWAKLDAAEYKPVVLGLIFLKLSQMGLRKCGFKFVEGKGDYEGAGPKRFNQRLTT